MFAIRYFLFLSWFLVALISFNHLHPFWDALVFSTSFLGGLYFVIIIMTLAFLSRRFIKQGLLIFFVFICLGYFLGPFLEPPADPLIHLQQAYEFCDKNSSQVPRKNKGFWHYSMSSNILFSKGTYAIAKTGQKVKIDGKVRLVDGLPEGSQAMMVEGVTNCTRVWGPPRALKLKQGSLSVWARLVDPKKKYSDLVRINNGNWLYIYHTGDGHFIVFYNNVTLGKSSMTVIDDKWHHYTFTWKDREQRFYIDGSEVLTGDISECKARTELFAIGWLGSNDTEQWHGPFTKILTFKRALSGSEVAALHRVGANETLPQSATKSVLLDLDFSNIVPDNSDQSISPVTILTRIDVLNGVLWGLLMVGLFILAKSAGLPDRWAFLSSLIAFLFFGTNRFSYFSYYSFAPSFSSLLIYWLWTAAFFFKRGLKIMLLGLVMGMISLPILWVNHLQEAAFMGFIIVIWLFWNITEQIWAISNTEHKAIGGLQLHDSNRFLRKEYHWYLPTHLQIWMKQYYLLILFFFLFILPQFEFFQKFISQWFERDLWQRNQELVFYWHNFHVIGKIWSYRVNDTLGIIGTIPVLLSIAFFWPKLIEIDKERKNRVLILGILPFVGYAIPLFNFIWISNSDPTDYYRLCYSQMFWIPITFFLYGVEMRYSIFFNKRRGLKNTKILRTLKVHSFKMPYFAGCLVIIVLISGVRSNPIYGKLDFLLLETRPWWNEWKPMIEYIMEQDKKTIYSDPITSIVLHGVFNYPIANKLRECSRTSIINVKSLDTSNTSHSRRCIINLHGFTPSWVPMETGHWQSDLANTSLYYQYDGISGEELIEILKKNPPKNCEIFF